MESARFADLASLIDKVIALQDDAALGRQAQSSIPLPSDLCRQILREIQTLKPSGQLHRVPEDSISRLLLGLDHTLRSAGRRKVDDTAAGSSDEDELDDDIDADTQANQTLLALDASLAALHILTTAGMSKKLFQEEMIEQIVSLSRFQTTHTIFPSYSSSASNDDGDDGGMGPPRRPSMKSGSSKKKSKSASSASKFGSKSDESIPSSAKQIYNRVWGVTELFAELLELQTMPDSIVLQATSLALSTFFEDSKIQELQQSSLGVVRTIFAHYPTHRVVIVDDILVSLGKLPTTKRGLRNFKLSDQQGAQQVQMVSALLLTLVQSCVVPPSTLKDANVGDVQTTATAISELITQVRRSHDEGDRTAQTILTSFIDKCTRKGDECDYKTLFENVIEDLLRACFQPEWPAAEQMLYFLVLILLKMAREERKEVGMRLIGLEALGNIAAKVQTLLLEVEDTSEETSSFVAELEAAQQDRRSSTINPGVSRRSTRVQDGDAYADLKDEAAVAEPENVDVKIMQKLLLDCLQVSSANDASLGSVRNFYVGQWIADEYSEVNKNLPVVKEDDDEVTRQEDEMRRETIRGARMTAAEVQCSGMISELVPVTLTDIMGMRRDETLCHENLSLAAKTLGSKRLLSRGFDNILKHILASLNETDARVRTKALKALATVVDADWTLLSNPVVKRAVEARFQDKQISVREAAIDLVGRFVLARPDLTHEYYKTFIDRTLDTGLSVRKRVIKVLRDICIQQPNFLRTPDICLRLLRRVNDPQEGIQDLVTKSFHQIWFAAPAQGWPKAAGEKQAMIQTRAICIAKVLSDANESTQMQAQASFEQLLKAFVAGDDSVVLLKVCKEMVNSLVNRLIELEENGAQAAAAVVAAEIKATFLTLHLFCQACPDLLVDHVAALWPHLKSSTVEGGKNAAYILYYTAKILATAIPRRKNMGKDSLKQVEETLVQLILTSTARSVVEASVHCLGSCVLISKNMEIATHTLQHVYMYLKDEVDNNHVGAFEKRKPFLLRSLFVCGLFCQHFDFGSAEQQASIASAEEELKDTSIRDIVFMVQMKFANHSDEQVRLKALNGFGFFALRHPHFMMRSGVKDLYVDVLESATDSDDLKAQVLENLKLVLVDEEQKMTAAAAASSAGETDPTAKKLTQMGGEDSGCTGVIVSHCETSIQKVMLSKEKKLRMNAFSVTKLMLRQGLVHPMEHVSYLVALSTDPIQTIRESAQTQLTDLNTQFEGFVSQKAIEGVSKAFFFRRLMQANPTYNVRGIWPPKGGESLVGTESAMLSHLYNMLHLKKNIRRAFLKGIVARFHDKETEAAELCFLADNLAHLPYATNEAPLFVIYQISRHAAIQGTHIQSQFRMLLRYDDVLSSAEEDDDLEGVMARIGGEVSPDLAALATVAQSLSILLLCKQYLQRTMGYTEVRCEAYRPDESQKENDSKVRRQLPTFAAAKLVDDLASPRGVAEQFIRFRELMQHGEYDFDAESADPVAGEADADGGTAGTDASTPARAEGSAKVSSSGGKKRTAKGSAKKSAKKKPAPTKKKVKRKTKKMGDSDSDEDDDDEWK
jgi:cohesin loading factor subunit SCC2